MVRQYITYREKAGCDIDASYMPARDADTAHHCSRQMVINKCIIFSRHIRYLLFYFTPSKCLWRHVESVARFGLH